jgi:hypothetical protein
MTLSDMCPSPQSPTLEIFRRHEVVNFQARLMKRLQPLVRVTSSSGVSPALPSQLLLGTSVVQDEKVKKKLVEHKTVWICRL